MYYIGFLITDVDRAMWKVTFVVVKVVSSMVNE